MVKITEIAKIFTVDIELYYQKYKSLGNKKYIKVIFQTILSPGCYMNIIWISYLLNQNDRASFVQECPKIAFFIIAITGKNQNISYQLDKQNVVCLQYRILLSNKNINISNDID